jgi:O-antigen ligase
MQGSPTYPARKKEGWERLLDAVLVLLAIALPLATRLVPLLIALVVVAAVGVRLRHGAGEWRRMTWKGPLSWMACFYLLHVAGMAWSSNISFGLFDLEVKAGFLVFPLLLWILPSTVQPDVPRIAGAFVRANVGAVVLCLIAALWRFASEWYLRHHGTLPEDPAWTNHFFESRFSFLLHPSYMAMYLCAALSFVLLRKGAPPEGAIRSWLVPSLLVLGVILCNSKMGWITLVAVFFVAGIGVWQDSQRRVRILLVALGGVVLFVILFMAFPTVSGKFFQALDATGTIDPSSDQSSALRRMAWDSALELFRQDPIRGVGTGDIKDELVALYERRGFIHAAAKRMNAHSQFLQTMAALGLPGLAGLLGMVLVPLVLAMVRHQRICMAFWLIILLSWSVESMAEVQAGVAFVCLVAWLLEIHAMPGNGASFSGEQPIPSPTHDPLQSPPHR